MKQVGFLNESLQSSISGPHEYEMVIEPRELQLLIRRAFENKTARAKAGPVIITFRRRNNQTFRRSA